MPNASSVTSCIRVRAQLPLLPEVTLLPPPPPPDTTGDVPMAMTTEVDVSLWAARLGHANKLSVRLHHLLQRGRVDFQLQGHGPRCKPSVTPVPVSAAVHERLGLMLNNGSLEDVWRLWCDGCGRLRSDLRTYEAEVQCRHLSLGPAADDASSGAGPSALASAEHT